MARLSMHDRLPYDEATTPPRVSTGDLPDPTDVQRVVTEAFHLYQPNADGVVADYIPALAAASPDLFGISVVGARGRSFEIGDVDTPFSIQSVSKPFVFALVCEAEGYDSARQHLGVNSTGFPFNSLMAVELNDARTMNPLVNAGAIATTSLVPGTTAEREVRARPRRAVTLRRPRAEHERGRVCVGAAATTRSRRACSACGTPIPPRCCAGSPRRPARASTSPRRATAWSR